MKFTDYHLLIPIQVYGTELGDYKEKGEFGLGWARIHYSELDNASWYEAYPPDRIGMSTVSEGFPLTVIKTFSNTYICNLPMREFEKKLNEFMERIDDLLQRNSGEAEQDLDI